MNDIVNYFDVFDEIIQLTGFETINNFATFCLYRRGIVISSKKFNTAKCHYEVFIDKERKIRDKNLSAILKNRGLRNKEQFVFVKDGGFYVEIIPHAK